MEKRVYNELKTDFLFIKIEIWRFKDKQTF